jgi:coproporphyrinogen III oxidase-like Fe-S oxidoreductase
LVQNEKNAGRYRQQVEAGRLAGTRGLVQSAEDQRRAAVIETLLCQEAVDLPADLLDEAREGLAPFLARGLAHRRAAAGAGAAQRALSSLHRRAVRCLSRRWASVQFGGGFASFATL